jgi:colanic acid biosynthesis protein WcaH
MTLSESDFASVVKNTPLVSIDLIICDPSGAVLMGWRNNEPAKNTWFVPGGRIRKGERIAEAFERIIRTETGLQVPFQEAQFGKVYEHLYTENCFGDPSFGTHYCVLSYIIELDHQPTFRTDDQHSRFAWLTSSSSSAIHPYSRAYFDLLDSRRH